MDLRRIFKKTRRSVLVGCLLSQSLMGEYVSIENEKNETIQIGIDSDDKFLDVIQSIESFLQADSQSHLALEWNLKISTSGLVARAKQETKRDYHTLPTKTQKEDIAYIVSILAWDNPVSVWKKESDLKRAGDRINHIHPLRFLETIFRDEKLIAGMEGINGRKVPKLKSEFRKGLTDSLREEGERDNLLLFVDDFATNIGINKKSITLLLEKKQFNEFIDTLIELKPRKNKDHYNM